MRSDLVWNNAVAVTPDDDTEQNFAGLYVGGAGDVTVKFDGDPVTFSGVAAGTFMPISVTGIMDTDTTATLILGLIA